MKVVKFLIGFFLAVVALCAGIAVARISLNHWRNSQAIFTPHPSRDVVERAPPTHSFYAGVRHASITPTRPVYLAGFDPKRISTGVHDSLYAHVLVLEDAEGRKIVVVTLDLLG